MLFRSLETGRIGRVSGNGSVDFLESHNCYAFVDVVATVNSYRRSLAVRISRLFHDVDTAGEEVVLSLNVSESVDTADDESGVLSETVEDNSERSLSYFVSRARDTDSAFRCRERLVTCKECEALGFFRKKSCGEVSVTETDVTLFCDGTGDTERLKTDTDSFSGLSGARATLFDRYSATYGVRPYRVFESDRLYAFYYLIAVYAFFETDVSSLFEILYAILFKSSVDLVYSSVITFKCNTHIAVPPELLFTRVDLLDGVVESAVAVRELDKSVVSGHAVSDSFHHLAEVDRSEEHTSELQSQR